MKRTLSGIQPTGIIHLGNYFGAIHNWLPLQKEYECFFFIADLHALTIFQKPEILHRNILDLTKLYLAVGLDPVKNIIFKQSAVKEHAELGWLLSCVTPISELERMTQFKDKSTQHKDNINAGLFTYPCLMAADILLYDTDFVPVGEDQAQHVELTRTIAKKFNNQYGDVLKIPEALINKVSARLKGLDDPEKKMSKSAPSDYNYIAMTDNPDLIRKKIKKAVTDSGTEIKFTPEKPALENLITIYHLTTGKSIEQIEKDFAGKGYGDFKKELAERLVEFLTPIQEKYNSISDADVEKILAAGAEKARKLAQAKMILVKQTIGL
ncbi:tryptophan--tRNA ligase [Candidatus Falkowbacteria bacterium]|nr:tryptophan--tRNA ligase [Candidatus Falkowbacteria bacterium]